MLDVDGKTALDIEIALTVARSSNPDLPLPSSVYVANLPSVLAGFTLLGTDIIVLNSSYMGTLEDWQFADLYNTIVHEGIHLRDGIRSNHLFDFGYVKRESWKRTDEQLLQAVQIRQSTCPVD